jgi:methionine-rich copper-binding protein CopC
MKLLPNEFKLKFNYPIAEALKRLNIVNSDMRKQEREKIKF